MATAVFSCLLTVAAQKKIGLRRKGAVRQVAKRRLKSRKEKLTRTSAWGS